MPIILILTIIAILILFLGAALTKITFKNRIFLHPRPIFFGLFLGWLALSGLGAAEAKPKTASGGFLGSILGKTIRNGLGLSAGDFAEFSLSRIRIVNARMAAPPIANQANTDTTFLQIDEIVVEYSPLEVLNKRLLRRVTISRPQVWVSELQRKMKAAADGKKAAGKTASDKDPKLIIQHLELKDVEIYLDTLRAQGLTIPLRFAQKDPIVLEGLSIADILTHPSSDKVVSVAADQVLVHSAYGPMAPLLSIGKIQLDFTWKGLLNREFEKLVISDPALYIGDDWFKLLAEFKNSPTRSASASPSSPLPSVPPAPALPPTTGPAQPKSENFIVKKFSIERLKLALSSYGVLKVELPFSFNYQADNVGLDDSGRFFLQSQLKVNESSFQLPQYNLSVTGLDGDIKFNWPPAAGTTENIVPTLKATSVTIKDLQLTNPWASLTFLADSTAATDVAKSASKGYLGFGTECYGGYLNGSVQCDFAQKWAANITGTGINIQAINAFRAQPIQGVFQLSVEAQGMGSLVNDCNIELQNARGIKMDFHLTGNISEFFQDITNQKPSPDDGVAERMAAICTTQRGRSGQIQGLKNSRLIGENQLGFLEARLMGIEKYYAGATDLIKAENADRKAIYEFIADRDQKTIDQVDKEYGQLWQERAFPGEWIESPTLGWITK